MKALKVIGVILIIAVIAIAGLFFYGISNLDSLIQTAVERFGSDATQTEVTLEGVEVELQNGRVQLSDLTIANPPGYSTDYAFALGRIAVQVDPSTLSASRDAVVVVDEITVDGASIIAELRGLQNSNLQELAGNVQSSLPEKGEEQPQPQADSVYTGPNFRVSRFEFSNAEIALVSQEFGDRTIEMPAVTANNLGGESGLPPEELAAALMNQVLDQAVTAVRNEVEGAAKRKVRSELKEKAEESLSEKEQGQLKELRDFLRR